MKKRTLRFGLALLVALGPSGLGRAQSGPSTACERALQVNEQQRAQCDGHNEQLADIRRRIEAFASERQKLREECSKGNTTACQELLELDGRVGILERQYTDLAQQGCQTPAPVNLTACRTAAAKETGVPNTAGVALKPLKVPSVSGNGLSQADRRPVKAPPANPQPQPATAGKGSPTGTNRPAAQDGGISRREFSPSSGVPASSGQGMASRPVSSDAGKPK